ncbi:uncharacterized protein N7511_005082 [Penicillium nucicola]|uniref:uncharacterized protein n=1 Tax=Penicillium nucicola TaxID=1850975 RepID=UPI002545B437|nr:uncharacterized protein N7511_011554 [Penicillium nucicola]XP_056978417.1 uncharacterized protein N7511_011559 [Penicillium nucicola]XP_056978419.1 uncharacterized protein N7511_011565 [Penicillium nucicola]XP_056983992.1 uncharacterized protein N7511_005082 [Penicillium nucicola]KAJ5741209.1 hypothetical protein N7511_011554 [Penicillium nucicola]KAJ5741214.1 hypothetical protein N7511_011559 [Penicillium nucicola]KAJ5741220.1 hypothetical protein N7511_011565 [Penicillium nucicola]KAJ57
MCRDEEKSSLRIFHTRLVPFLVVKVVAFGAPITAGRHHPPHRCFPGPPNLYVGPRWLPRRGARSPGAYVPGTAGIPGGSRPAESAVRRRCPRGLDPSPEGRMPQPASARKGV